MFSGNSPGGEHSLSARQVEIIGAAARPDGGSMRLNSFTKCSFLVALLCTAIASAQEYRGRVQGTVLDTTKAAIPGAAVSLLNTDTGGSSTRQTDERGDRE